MSLLPDRFSFGRRKIRKINLTPHISLPKLWIHNYKLEFGDELEICITEEGYLLLKPVNMESVKLR